MVQFALCLQLHVTSKKTVKIAHQSLGLAAKCSFFEKAYVLTAGIDCHTLRFDEVTLQF